jgi:hypothetical protein
MLLLEGCASELEFTADPSKMLRRLGDVCLSSMDAVLDQPAVLAIREGSHREVTVTLDDAEACVRAGVAGDANVSDVVASLVDPDGVVHAGSETRAPVSLVGPQGPICLAGPGKAKVQVVARHGSGKVAVQVWAARR